VVTDPMARALEPISTTSTGSLSPMHLSYTRSTHKNTITHMRPVSRRPKAMRP
jgi:hypothetical protein